MSDHGARAVASFLGAGFAELVTLPVDIAKVRLQVQSSKSGSPARYRGMVDCIRKTSAEEGPAALWKGLQPALLRQCLYTSCSLILYEPIRDTVTNATGGLRSDGSATYMQRLIAGGTAGAVSIAIFNPTEVLKTRMQTSPVKVSMTSVARQVYAKHGVAGFWSGLKPNVARTFLVNAAELGTYDQAKQALIPYVGNNAFAHLGASTIGGVTSALVSTPADVIKTRLMNSAGQEGANQYNGVISTCMRIFREESPAAFYKGFFPIIVRKVIWCSVFFVLYEKLREEAQLMEKKFVKA